jgi:phosphatidylinositol glycan class N
MSSGRHEQAQELSSSLIDLSLQGLHYFQTYDWPFLLSVVSLGYVGWIAFLVLHVVAHNTNMPAYVRHRLAQSNRNVPSPPTSRVYFACGGSPGRPG